MIPEPRPGRSDAGGLPAYEALAGDIRALGVSCAFGLMSDDTALLVTALDAMGVRFFAARHENNAIAMAEGYAAASGGLAIAILGRGPATANGLHGAIYALRSGSRVLLVYGDAPFGVRPANRYGPDTKALDAVGVLRASGLPAVVATDAATARLALAQAVAHARRGATALLLPMNVQTARIDAGVSDPGSVADPAGSPIAPRESAIAAASEVLQRCRRPLIVAGRGAHLAGAREAIVRLADRIGAALATTVKAKDLFRGHPFDCGIVGSLSHARGRRLIEQADVALVFGAGLNQRTTSYGAALPDEVALIQVDCVRGNIGRWFPADVAVVGDARLAAERLAQVLPERAPGDCPLRSDELRRLLAQSDPASDFAPSPTPRTVDPRSLALALDRILPRQRNLVYDAGNFLQVLPYLSVPDPAHLKLTSDFASVGMGLGTAIGYAIATPQRTTVLVVGDGGLLMTLGELETVARLQLPLVIVVMNDCAYGAELHYLRLREMPVALSRFPDVDFAPAAEAFGFRAATVRTLGDLQALAPALANPDGPILIDCKINGAIAAPFLLEGEGRERRSGEGGR